MRQDGSPAADPDSVNEIYISLLEVSPPPWVERCRLFCLKVLNSIGVINWEVSLLFCNDAVIRGLNNRFRGCDKATDVLSFPQAEPKVPVQGAQHGAQCSKGAKPKAVGRRPQVPVQGGPQEGQKWPAGDVAISLDALQRNAKDNTISEEEELKRLLIHGFLHLKGMDHHEKKSEMLKIQEVILEEFMEERII